LLVIGWAVLVAFSLLFSANNLIHPLLNERKSSFTSGGGRRWLVAMAGGDSKV
jgi:hypothetical protein